LRSFQGQRENRRRSAFADTRAPRVRHSSDAAQAGRRAGDSFERSVVTEGGASAPRRRARNRVLAPRRKRSIRMSPRAAPHRQKWQRNCFVAASAARHG
jgi:hypothetical protein